MVNSDEVLKLNFKKILTTLKNRNVKFVLIGGCAAVVYGSSYPTYDVDICYARNMENLENIVKALAPFHPTLRDAPKDLPFKFDVETLKNVLNLTLSTDIGNIDLFAEVKGIGSYDEVIKYSETVQIYNIKCYVLSLEGLIKNKKAVGRQKDKEALVELEAILEIQKRKGKVD